MNVTHVGEVGELATNGRWQPRYRHTRHLCRHLMEVTLGLRRRKVFQMPPRHGKTFLTATVFPFHYLTTHPRREVIYVAHSDDFAAEQGEQLRNMIEDHGAEFGIGVSKASKAKDDFSIVDLDGRPTGGSFRTFGIGNGIHGRGCSLLILDDLFKNVEQALSASMREQRWRTYTSSLHTRLTPDGAVVSIGTPLHEDDWFGRARAAEADGGDAWDWVHLPAFAGPDDQLGREEGDPLWPEGGWDAAALEAKRAAMVAAGAFRDWASQYDPLEPVSGDGVTEWPSTYFDRLAQPWAWVEPMWTSVLSIDTSKGARAQKKGDWQAFVFTEADGGGHLRVNSELCRLDVKGLRAKALELIERWDPRAVVVETNGAGYALMEDLWELRIPALGRHHSSHENKVTRITQRLGRALESGVLHFDPTPSNRILLEQLRLFPHAKYDDGPDSLEMGLEFISQLKLPKHRRKVTYQTRAAA